MVMSVTLFDPTPSQVMRALALFGESSDHAQAMCLLASMSGERGTVDCGEETYANWTRYPHGLSVTIQTV